MLKARIVPHGNRDDEKDDVRKDSSAAQFFAIRLVLYISTLLGFRLGMADIKGAYLQSGPIKRTIYVRPPREWRGARGMLWMLLKLPYGIVEAGRQWQKVVEEWMLTTGRLLRIRGISQLFLKRNASGKIILLVAKVTDDFLIAGSLEQMKQFTDELQQRFVVGKVVINEPFIFNGCHISQNPFGDIAMPMVKYLERIKLIGLSRLRKKMLNERATKEEEFEYRSLAGVLNFLAGGVLPPASYVVSYLQQQTGHLNVAHLRDANAMTKELLELQPVITFKKPRSQIVEATVCTFSDASFNIGRARSYGQSGIILGLRITTSAGEHVYHPIDWTSHKQDRVVHSSYGAEIIACASADDRTYLLRSSFRSIFPRTDTRNELLTDSRGLFDTITTLHDGKEYRLRQTVERLRNSFESQELDTLRWIPGTSNIADALTKRSMNLYKLLNRMCVEGLF